VSSLNHAWCDHVVHVELFGSNAKVAAAYARFLSDCFNDDRDVFVAVADDDRVEVRSELHRAVSAADVAKLLAEADMRASSIYERDEWAVGRGDE
jgi:hypothetical protein